MKLRTLFLTACISAGMAGAASAQSLGLFNSSGDTVSADYGTTRAMDSENYSPGSYVAGIWVDPDGCHHWVMDLGIEGMMDAVLAPDGRPICGRGCGSLPGDVLFNSGSASLTGAGRDAVDAVALQLRSTGRNSIGVIGHTDADGDEGFNLSLSQQRAQNVAAALRANGVNTTTVTGAGESNPIADNSTSEGKRANRRVELVCQ